MKHRKPKSLAPRIAVAATVAVVAMGTAGGTVAASAAGDAHLSPAVPSVHVAQMSSTPHYAAGRVLVKFSPSASARQRSRLEATNHARTIGHIRDLGASVLKVPAGAERRVVHALESSGKVTYAERDGVVAGTDVTPNDPYWTKQWGENLIHAQTAWSTTAGSSSVVVAILDTGMNSALPEFSGRVVAGYNFVANNADTTDDNSHGTAAAGVALAQGNNGTDVAGLCWSCTIMPVKVLDANAAGNDSITASGITWAVDHGAKILSLSLGGTATSTTLSNAVSYAENHGALVVAAAGNNSSSAAFYPAAYPGVLSVAATDQYDALYSYSDYGSWVDVAAPGSNYSTWPSGNVYLFGGTSSATPVVAGLAGLLWSASPSLTETGITNVLMSTADPLKTGVVGGGRVNAASAMAAVTGTPATTSPSPSPSATGSVSPSPSPSPSVSSTPTPAPTQPAPTATTTSFGGNVTGTWSKSLALTTSGGATSATVTGNSAPVSVSIVDASGTTVATATGGSGISVSATLPAGSFSVVIQGTGKKTKFQASVTYFA